MPDKHLSSQFDADLNSLSSRLLEMGGLVESQISTAMRAFTQMDLDTCNIVIENEKLVNDLEEEDQKVGFEIVRRALKEPIRQIASNAGLSADVVIENISNKDNLIGLDARNGTYVSMLESGIIDPAKVTRSALQNAVSIAVLVLTTETLIVDKPIDSEKVLIQEGTF
jgi:chaperonin GroEL (HSP60 family)